VLQDSQCVVPHETEPYMHTSPTAHHPVRCTGLATLHMQHMQNPPTNRLSRDLAHATTAEPCSRYVCTASKKHVRPPGAPGQEAALRAGALLRPVVRLLHVHACGGGGGGYPCTQSATARQPQRTLPEPATNFAAALAHVGSVGVSRVSAGQGAWRRVGMCCCSPGAARLFKSNHNLWNRLASVMAVCEGHAPRQA